MRCSNIFGSIFALSLIKISLLADIYPPLFPFALIISSRGDIDNFLFVRQHGWVYLTPTRFSFVFKPLCYINIFILCIVVTSVD